uniref:Cyclin-dependent kinases regulatory subunit n=1 Tax=Vombatus ursinus TaxID=29139 RepID=A0A4X2LU55_VOMUR
MGVGVGVKSLRPESKKAPCPLPQLQNTLLCRVGGEKLPISQPHSTHQGIHGPAQLLRYRHVMLPKDIAKLVPKTHLMSESEWRNLGVQQSQGWVHYMIHEPEPHILLFRRPLPKKPKK